MPSVDQQVAVLLKHESFMLLKHRKTESTVRTAPFTAVHSAVHLGLDCEHAGSQNLPRPPVAR